MKNSRRVYVSVYIETRFQRGKASFCYVFHECVNEVYVCMYMYECIEERREEDRTDR